MTNTNHEWPFLDPPNTAVFTSSSVMDNRDWVHYVTHDEEDGAWQFHPSSGPLTEGETIVVGLKRVMAIEPKIRELADLPLGWHAWRESRTAPWQTGPRRPGRAAEL
jgi:hypothetical protein